jgi:hypothetical protein
MPPALTCAVALGTYNGARFLGEQLTSILRQDRLPDEIVVSDDRSSDGTVEIAEALLMAAREAGIRVVLLRNPENVGVTANFAAAIAECTADVVVLSDQDDVWHPDHLSSALRAFEEDPSLDLRHADARLVDSEGSPLGRSLFESLTVAEDELARIEGGDAFSVYLRRNLATGATMSFRRRLVGRALPFPAEWVHDEWLAMMAAATGHVAVSRTATVDYRQHGANEIGVAAPTLRYRVGRMLATTAERNRLLAVRSTVLAERLADRADVPAEVLAAARAKAAFETRRAALPRSRPARLVGILRADRSRYGAVGGGYARFASQGRLDMVRDLLLGHPPR